MKYRIHHTLLLCALFVASGLFSACDDFLTVLPEDFTTEDQYWESKQDLLNVRAGAYKQLTNINNQIVYWGELRSDNVKLNQLSNNELLFLQQAILRPTNSNFDWSAVYTGISLCNLILSKGEQMTNEPLKDPTFSKSDFTQYKADITGLRALYYFYLVRAFRDVPYVTTTVSSDEEARRLYIPVTSGEAILGELCDQLEQVLPFAFTEESFTSSAEKKGYFTRTTLHALLSDMYLWRGCLLKNYSAKRDAAGHARMLNTSDEMVIAENGDTSFVTVDGVTLSNDYANEQSKLCFQHAVDHANEVLKIQMLRYYNAYRLSDDMARRSYYDLSQFDYNTYTGDGVYPLYPTTLSKGDRRVNDDLYTRFWYSKNGSETIFDIQYDNTNTNPVYSTYGSFSGSTFTAGTWVASDFFMSKINTKVDPSGQGLGNTDLRTLQTFAYTQTAISASAIPLHKNIAASYTIDEVSNMAKGFTGENIQYKQTMNSNWPIYRLTDVLLIKAEALCRLGENYDEANNIVNYIYARNNPAMSYSTVSDMPKETGESALLMKIYNERQREFVGEGKRWFDIVRQAEAGDYYGGRTVAVMESLGDFISVTNVVKNRVRSLWALYCPITDSEMRVEGVNVGGYLVQNPVWERYSEIK